MRQEVHAGGHHWMVEPDYSVVTKTVPKHLVNRHLTSLASGAIIDETGRRREDSRFSEAVCLETITYTTNSDSPVRSFSPVR
jgi:hypothetical protein